MEVNLYKIEYSWYEDEHEETLLAKNVERKEFEKDLIEARNFAKSLIGKEIKEDNYLGKGYAVECLPEFYDQIIWFLTEKKGYIECYFDKDITYDVGDFGAGKNIQLEKREEKTKISEL